MRRGTDMSDDEPSTDGAEHRDYGGPMADQETAGGLLLPNLVSATAKMVDTVYRSHEVSGLRRDQDMRGDAPVSDQYYDGHKHEDLYNMVHENLDPHDATTAGDLINDIGNWLSDVSYLMRNAVKQEQVEWQGEAANKAHGLFSANADWAEGTRDAAWLVSNRYKEQAETASNARSNMPEPTGFDMKEELNKGVAKIASGDISGGADVFSDIPDKQDEADEKHAEAVQVMRDMDNGYHQTASTQPAFAKPPDPADSDSTSTSTAGYVSGDSGGVSSPGGTGGGATGSGATGGGGAAGSGSGAAGGAGSAVSGAPSTAGRSYSGSGPVPSTSPGGNGGGGAPSGAGTSARPGSGAAAAPVTGGGNLRGVGSDKPRAGLSRGGAGGSGTPRSGSSAAPRATGNSTGAGERSAAGRATGSEPGGSKGAVPRGGAAAARAADSSSGGGRPMAGAPGAGRGGGGGDEEEHQRKYEFGEDPDEIFGEEAEYTEDGHRIVPPVIGG